MIKKLLMLSFLVISLSSFALNDSEDRIQTIGISGNYIKKHTKSKNEFRPLPLMDLRYSRFTLKGPLELGFLIYEEPNFACSLIVTPLSGYFDGWAVKGSKMKKGYKKIKNRNSQIMGGLSIDFAFEDMIIGNAQYSFGKHGSSGSISTSKVYFPHDRLAIIPSISLRVKDKKYVDYYVGISESEKNDNEKIEKTYKGKSSIGLGGSITAEAAIKENIVLTSFIGCEYVDDNVKKSPIVNTNMQLYGGLGVRITF